MRQLQGCGVHSAVRGGFEGRHWLELELGIGRQEYCIVHD